MGYLWAVLVQGQAAYIIRTAFIYVKWDGSKRNTCLRLLFTCGMGTDSRPVGMGHIVKLVYPLWMGHGRSVRVKTIRILISRRDGLLVQESRIPRCTSKLSIIKNFTHEHVMHVIMAIIHRQKIYTDIDIPIRSLNNEFNHAISRVESSPFMLNIFSDYSRSDTTHCML